MALIQSVNKGDIIVERGDGGKKRMVPVRKVELKACSKPSVHINDSACYDWNTHVEVAKGDETLGDLRDKVEEIDTNDNLDGPGVLVTVGPLSDEEFAELVVRG